MLRHNLSGIGPLVHVSIDSRYLFMSLTNSFVQPSSVLNRTLVQLLIQYSRVGSRVGIDSARCSLMLFAPPSTLDEYYIECWFP